MKRKDLRIVFMGTPEFAVATLKMLVERKYQVVGAVTQPDKPVGRHQTELRPSPVKQFAVENGIPVLQPEKMKDPDFLKDLKSLKADLQVVVAFRMLPEVVWAMPRFGTFNVHAALLPQYRGAAPINWAIINGEKKTGVTTFFLDHDIDTGRIFMQESITVYSTYNVEDVYDKLMILGADVARKTINEIIKKDGKVKTIPQNKLMSVDTVLYPAPKIYKEMCEICWSMPTNRIHDFIRGMSPVPGAWTTLSNANGNQTVMKVYKTAVPRYWKTMLREKQQENSRLSLPGGLFTHRNRLYCTTQGGVIELLEVQLSGKKRMNATDFLRGFRDLEGCSLG